MKTGEGRREDKNPIERNGSGGYIFFLVCFGSQTRNGNRSVRREGYRRNRARGYSLDTCQRNSSGSP